jgi:hypothetical protein
MVVVLLTIGRESNAFGPRQLKIKENIVLQSQTRWVLSRVGRPDGSGMGLILDPWAGSWADTLTHLLIGHGSGRD